MMEKSIAQSLNLFYVASINQNTCESPANSAGSAR